MAQGAVSGGASCPACLSMRPCSTNCSLIGRFGRALSDTHPNSRSGIDRILA